MAWRISSTSLGSALGGMSCRRGTEEGQTKRKAESTFSDRVHARLQETAGNHILSEPARVTGLTAASTLYAVAGYKYKEVVRKRAEREDLLGVECPECRRFYEACQTWSSVPPCAAPKCGHALQGENGRPECSRDKRPHVQSVLIIDYARLLCNPRYNPAAMRKACICSNIVPRKEPQARKASCRFK